MKKSGKWLIAACIAALACACGSAKASEETPAPAESETQLREIDPKISPAAWAIRYAASKEDVIAVLSGMSTLDQVKDNVKTMKDFKPLREAEQKLLESLAEAQKAAGPEHTGEFRK